MKIKIILLFAFLMLAFSCSNNSLTEVSTTEVNSNKPLNDLTLAKLDVSISVTWEIGRKSRNCEGFGICRRVKTVITIDPLPPIDIEQFRQGKFFYGDLQRVNKNQVLISVDSVSRQYINEYFGGDYLRFDEDMYFDFTDVGAASNFRVRTGIYPITYDTNSGKYYITLDNQL